MSRFLAQVMVIARRDFTATVLTPAFLVFLMMPVFMFAMASVGGLGASQLATNAASNAEIVAILGGRDAARLEDADTAMRKAYRSAELKIVAPERDPAAQARALMADKKRDVYAVLYGPLERPTILRTPESVGSAPYLAELAEQVLRDRRANLAPGERLSRPEIADVARAAPSKGNQQGSGFAAVFVLFLLTILLAGQAVSMMAEEKGNKVIEILAAAVSLEAAFLGKLIGMFGAALLFIAFWGAIGGGALLFGAKTAVVTAAPAVGWAAFVLLCAAYFSMAYMLLAGIFLGVGAQAATVREIQLLSLPITIFQVAMFGLSSAAASQPDGWVATAAQVFPFSSPFAMAARGATDPALWPHFLALAWQLIWVALVVIVGARMFRRGVLKSGSGKLFNRKTAALSEG